MTNPERLFRKSIFCWLLVFLFSYTGQSQFSLSGEFRPRLESRHGFRTLAGPDSKAANFISQRSRITMDFKKDRYRTKLSAQDVRIWGDEGQIKDIPSFSLHEAWAEFDLSDAWSLRMGRQELVYDDHRLLGNVDWVQQGRSHDAALLKYNNHGWQVHLGLALNNAGETLFRTPYALSNYKTLSFFWLQKEVSDQFAFSLMSLSDGFQVEGTTDVNHRRTIGPQLSFNHNDLKLKGTFYYQFGRTPTDQQIRANMYALQADYKIDDVAFGIGIERLSGTDGLDQQNDDVNTFHTLYGTNHKFYGLMDYFLNIPGDTDQGGLTDIFAKVSFAFNNKTSILTTIHFFSLSDQVADPSNPAAAIDKNLGTEIDLVMSHKIQPDVNLNAGWSMLSPSQSMQIIKGGDKDTFQSWFWIMFSFKPTFFSTASQ